jgi:Zn-dependent protease with chaperone function
MPVRWRSLFLPAAFLWAITFGALAPISALAQAASKPVTSPVDSDLDDDDAKPVAFLGVSVTLDANGNANVQASYYLTDKTSLPLAEIKDALQSALGCTLQNSPRLRPIPGYYAGSCTVPSSVQGFLRQGRISAAPLQDFSRLHGITSTSVQLQLPDSDVLETIPDAHQNSAVTPKVLAAVKHYLGSHFFFSGTPEKPLPPEIVFRYGYASSTLQRSAAILFLVLFSPLVLFVWLGRKALSAGTADKAVVWFSYMRSLRWILNASLIAWWIALDYCHAEPLLRFLSSGTRFAALGAHPVAYEALSWVPPAILWLLCYRISHPVQQKLRGLHWTKRELTLQALYSALAGLFPFAMFLTGLRVLGTGGFRSAMFWWVGAFLLRVIAAQALLKITGMQPQALSSGDLRDRAFGMAERLGVKLQQVYLIPSGKGQIANAFARTNNTISFTDFLLKRMSQREVDYVMAHELTHLKLKHPAKLGYAYMAGVFLAISLLSVSTPFLHGSAVARYGLAFVIVSVFPYFWSRRFEYSADAGTVATTGDPRAAISALFKLSELNMMPIHWSKWSEKWLTHPSSLRRARAIAKKAGIPFEEIPAIAREGAAETRNYTIPPSAAPGAKIHSTQRTKSLTTKLSFALVGLLAFVPSLFCLAAIHFAPPVKWIFFAAAAPATLLSLLLLANYWPRLTRGTLVAALNKKLADQGIQAASWSGTFVGFAPAAAPRIYAGTANWDIGQLFLRSDRLCYCGEETKFALRQDQISAIKLAGGLPALLPHKRIYIAWKDSERGACGVFNIVCGNPNSSLHANKLTTELEQRLRVWWKTSPVTRPLPPQLAELTSPEVRAVTSQIPGERWKPRKLFKELLWTAIFSCAGAIMCGLPFHLLPYLLASAFSSTYARAGIHYSFSSPGAGWFAIAVAVFVRFIAIFPTLRYRDLPKLTADTPARRAETPPASLAGKPNPAAPEKVTVD